MGLTRRSEIDTSRLPEKEAAEYEQLARKAAFFDLPKEIRPEKPGADRFQYTLTIEDHGKLHSVTVYEGAVPSVLRPLIEKLIQHK